MFLKALGALCLTWDWGEPVEVLGSGRHAALEGGIAKNLVINIHNTLMQSYLEIKIDEKYMINSVRVLGAVLWDHWCWVYPTSLCDLSAQGTFGCSCPAAAVRFAFLAGLNFLQHVRTSPEGYAHFTLSGDYYNRALSGQCKAHGIVGFKN